jgi:WD40 repeat protein
MQRFLLALLVLPLAALGRADEPPEEAPLPTENVGVTLNTGGHWANLRAMVFTPDGRRLVTAQPNTVMVWSVATGHLERTIRLATQVSRMAMSPDGRTVAAVRWVGGPQNAVWLLDTDTGAARIVRNLPCGQYDISSLAFSPDGERLAWSTWYHAGVIDVASRRHAYVTERINAHVDKVAFGLDGTQLLVTGKDAPHRVYALPPVEGKKLPIELKKPRFSLQGSAKTATNVAWAPDGSRFASWIYRGSKEGAEIHLWKSNSKVETMGDDESPRIIRIPAWPNLNGLQFVGPDRLIAYTRWANKVWVARIDLRTSKVERFEIGFWEQGNLMALSADGKYLAATCGPGFQVTIFDLEKKRGHRKVGTPSGMASDLRWGPDNRSVSWKVEGLAPKAEQTEAAEVVAGLHLGTLDPLTKADLAEFRGERHPKDWKLVFEDAKDRTNKTRGLTVVRGGKRTETAWGSPVGDWTAYLTADGKPRLIVSGTWGDGDIGIIELETGKVLAVFAHGRAHVSAVSPDGRFLLLNAHDALMGLWRIDRKPTRLLTILAIGNEWIVWTPQGYFAASPGGERLIGWFTRKDNYTPLTFYPAQRFRQHFYRPDVIRLVLEKGSVPAALEAARVQVRDVEQVLPPRATVQVKQDGAKVTVEASAEAGSPGHGVTALHLLLDGRPVKLDGDRYAVEKFATAVEKDAHGTWTVTVEPGRHTLSVRAHASETYAISEEVAVEVRPQVAAPPKRSGHGTLHYLGVGVNHFKHHPELELKGAVPDVNALEKCLRTACAARFEEFDPLLLTDEKATREAIIEALTALQKKAKPSDVVIVHYSSHGEVDANGGLYLLTSDSKRDDLKSTAVPGQQLRDILGQYQSQVLLVLDACHSGKFPLMRPPTDPLSRLLADDSCGVAVMTAALAHQKAEDRATGGVFTQALIAGLDGKAKPAEPSTRLYVHNLFTYVFDAVTQATSNRQMPLYLPSGSAPPIVLKE